MICLGCIALVFPIQHRMVSLDVKQNVYWTRINFRSRKRNPGDLLMAQPNPLSLSHILDCTKMCKYVIVRNVVIFNKRLAAIYLKKKAPPIFFMCNKSLFWSNDFQFFFNDRIVSFQDSCVFLLFSRKMLIQKIQSLLRFRLKQWR